MKTLGADCIQVYLISAFYLADHKPGNAANFFQRVSESIKLKHYSQALEDLNAAIEADPRLSEAYWHRATALRQSCRFFHVNAIFAFFSSNVLQGTPVYWRTHWEQLVTIAELIVNLMLKLLISWNKDFSSSQVKRNQLIRTDQNKDDWNQKRIFFSMSVIV